jgi:predicted  nucleic acid-binding Zn-ribbon protein
MLDVIEKLLVLQDRDRKILRVKDELAHVPPQRQALQAKATVAQKALEEAKFRLKKLEADRKELELEVAAKQQHIERYTLQQYQTKRNDEYRALAHEIQTARAAIFEIENRELDLMEQAEQNQKEAARLAKEGAEIQQVMAGQLDELEARACNLAKELVELEADRGSLAAALDLLALNRYERLAKNKGETAVVGIERGVCGGCHMRLSRQTVVHCQAQKELICCPNCGRLLYFTPEMDVAVTE